MAELFDPFEPEIDTTALIKYSYGSDIFPGKDITGASVGVKIHDFDPYQEYIYNSYGFRSSEFTSETEIIFSGCSFTEGVGVPESQIWSSKVANSLGMSYSNLAKSGSSPYYAVRNIFGYFKEYGHPKYLFCLFPSYVRYVAASSPNLFVNIPEDRMGDSLYGVFSGVSRYDGLGFDNAPKYLKRPYDLDDVVPNEFAFMLNGVAISNLIQYCKVAGIKFLWSTWDRSFSTFIEKAINNQDGYDFSGYVDIENYMWFANHEDTNDVFYYENYDKNSFGKSSCCDLGHKSRTDISCHRDLYDLFPNNFHRGTDSIKIGDTIGSHWGVHHHAHVAEKFLEQL